MRSVETLSTNGHHDGTLELPLDRFLEMLDNVRERQGGGWKASCPNTGAHNNGDENPSLDVDEGKAFEGSVIFQCRSQGCTHEEILDALGLAKIDLRPRIVFPDGKVAYQVKEADGTHRLTQYRKGRGENKDVKWKGKDDKWGNNGIHMSKEPLYGSELIADWHAKTVIALCEGPMDADSLLGLYVPAVGTIGGSGVIPSRDALSVLRGRTVTLWPDDDASGHKHMHSIAAELKQLGCRVKWFEWTDPTNPDDGAGATDHPLVKAGNVKAVKEMLANAEAYLPPQHPEKDGAVSWRYANRKFRRIIDEMRHHKGITGMRTGLPCLDRVTGGLNKGRQYLIAARANQGKSLLASQIAITVAQQGYRVLYQTPDMQDEEVMERLALHAANIPYKRFLSGDFDDREARGIREAADRISDLPWKVDGYGVQTVERIRRNIEEFKPDLVVVDYLQLLTPRSNHSSLYHAVTEVSKDITALKSGNHPLALLTAVQFSRKIEGRQSESGSASEPRMSDIRDSGQIEQDADVIMAIHRPNKPAPGEFDEQEELYLMSLKVRRGQNWKIPLYFDGGHNWLTDANLHRGPVWIED